MVNNIKKNKNLLIYNKNNEYTEEKFKAIFDSTNDGMIVAEQKNKHFILGNKTILKMLRYSLEEFVNLNVSDIHPHKNLDYVVKQYNKQMLGKVTVSKDLPVKRKDGTIFYADVSASSIKIGGKRYVLGVFRDTTERKKAEEILLHSEKKYRTLIEFSPVGIFLINSKGNIIDLNSTGLNILGSRSAKETKAINVFTFPLLVNAGFSKKIKECFKKGVHNIFEFPYTSKWGKSAYLRCNFTPIFDKNKKINNVQLIVEDITEKKKFELNLIRINRSLRMVSSINQALIHITDQKKLLNKACEVAVRVGGYSLAWVGFLEYDKNKSINPVAEAGTGKEYVKKAKLTWANTLRGRGPGGVSARTGKLKIIKNIETDRSMAPWKKDALKLGYRSVISLPLVNNMEVFGIILIYSNEVDIFSKEEINILNELTSDLSFGIATQGIHDDMSRLKKAVQTSGEIIYMTNNKGIITFINSEFTKLYGYTSDEVVGKVTPRILKSGRRTHKEYVELWKKLTTGKIVKDEHDNKSKNGSFLTVESAINPIYDKKRNIIGYLTIQRDITRIKKIEDKLKESEEKYRRLFETAKDSILILDAESGEIVDSNPFVQDLLEFSEKELVGKKIYEIGLFRDIVESKEKFIELQNKGYVRYDDLPLKTKSGKLKQVEFISNVYLVAGKKVVQCNIRDITERIKREKELEQAKSDFMSLASHQLRTPLSATKWVLESLMNDKNFSPKQQEKMNNLVISNERLIGLVNDLLDVTRIESGKLVVNKQLINLGKIISNLSLSLKPFADSKYKNISIDIPTKLKDIYCDPILVHEAIENLLSNAIVYSKEDSKEIEIKVIDRKDDYLISIHNEGVVMSLTDKKLKIFDKFVRGDNAQVIQPSGSGLGLFITKNIIEASGGTVWYESHTKSGTTFYLTIIKNNIKKHE